MLNIPDYTVHDLIHQGARSSIYRGQRNKDLAPIVAKVNTRKRPPLREIVRLKQEYTLMSRIRAPGLLAHLALERLGNSFALIMEDIGAVSLAAHLHGQPLPVDRLLPLAISLSSTLDAIHRQGIIHRDLNLTNIVVKHDGSSPTIIDFGIASLLGTERQKITTTRLIEGTFTHISPEQTGRIGWPIDHRSDLYSLGVCLYEMLTGRLPFTSGDPLEMTFHHLATVPEPPARITPGIPDALSEVIMKLLAKAPPERYQSAGALRADLERIQDALKQDAAPVLMLDQHRGRDRFELPRRLYGRAAEVERLLSAFTRVSGSSSALVLVSGYSGTGKSSLVYEIQPSIVKSKGWFISGKFDQHARSAPYGALVQALRALLLQILAEDEDQVGAWRRQMSCALGDNARVITEFIPEVERLIGEPSPLPALSSADAQRRFNDTMRRFVRVFTSRERPLVLFLDDLQWADPDTLALIEVLVTDADIHHLLLIGAYRDNEIGPHHALRSMPEKVRADSAWVDELRVEPLDAAALGQLVGDALHCSIAAGAPLVELLMRTTKGNPFYVGQLLAAWHQEKLLWYDSRLRSWSWDMAAIEQRGLTEDILGLMVTRIKKLGPQAQAVLRTGACLGNTFDLKTLALVHGRSLQQTATELWPVLQTELLLPANDAYKFTVLYDLDAVEDEGILSLAEGATYRFLHDRVQQAAYSLVPADERAGVHLHIGRTLLASTSQQDLEGSVFDIVMHYNAGRALVTDVAERYRLAELNLLACQRARASSSFEAALELATVAMECLPDSGWADDHRLTLACYLARSEAEILSGNFARAMDLLSIAERHALTMLDRCKICELMVLVYKVQNELHSAFETGARMLDALGLRLELSPDPERMLAEEAATAAAMAAHPFEHLHEGPAMTDPTWMAACRILQEMSSAAYCLGSGGVHLIAMKQVQLALAHGYTLPSVFGYIMYALGRMHFFDDIEGGYRLGCVSLRLHERLQDPSIAAKLLCVWGGHIQPYREPLGATREVLAQGFVRGLAAGDYQWAGYCAASCAQVRMLGDTSLDDALAYVEDVMPTLQRHDPVSFMVAGFTRQALDSLRERKPEPWVLTGQWCDEDEIIRLARASNDSTTYFMLYALKLSLALIFEEHDRLLAYQAEAEAHLVGGVGLWLYAVFHYHQSLALLALHDRMPPADREVHLARVRKNASKIETWMRHAPTSFEHMYLLIQAELERVAGQADAAMKLYDRAVASARENGFLQDQALAAELAARFYRARGAVVAADAYLRDAAYAYGLWGAEAKARQLADSYHLAGDRAAPASGTITTTSDQLDVFAVLKASQAISSEIVLDSLLSALMRTVVESAGAELGLLILVGPGEELTIEAAMPEGAVELPQPVQGSGAVPASIIAQVIRHREPVCHADASDAVELAGDAYIARKRPRSVLCLPILRSGTLVGLLYLENNMITGTFTPQNRQALQVLAAQAAVSLENARLYEELEQRVESRTRELRKTRDELARAAHRAGMAEVAANVLHNAGNFLNSIITSASVLHDATAHARADKLGKAVELIEAQGDDLGRFMMSERGQTLVGYLGEIARSQRAWLATMEQDLAHLHANAERLARIIDQQRSYQSDERLVEMLDVTALVEEALELHDMERREYDIEVRRELGAPPKIPVERYRLQQVLTNIIHNAVLSLAESPRPRILTVRITQPEDGGVSIAISDSGIGISRERLPYLFSQGYSTRKEGHGYGLHYCAIAVSAMRGRLSVTSDGPGLGATFTLTLPSAISPHENDFFVQHDLDPASRT